MLNQNQEKEEENMEEETKKEEEKSEVIEETTENETEKEETKEPSIEEKYKELEEKYNALYKEKTDKDREIRHTESYKKYDLSQENINLLKRYLSNTDDIEEELQTLNKDFPHIFNKNKDTNISNSLNIKEKFKEKEVDNSKLGMVG